MELKSLQDVLELLPKELLIELYGIEIPKQSQVHAAALVLLIELYGIEIRFAKLYPLRFRVLLIELYGIEIFLLHVLRTGQHPFNRTIWN